MVQSPSRMTKIGERVRRIFDQFVGAEERKERRRGEEEKGRSLEDGEGW